MEKPKRITKKNYVALFRESRGNQFDYSVTFFRSVNSGLHVRCTRCNKVFRTDPKRHYAKEDHTMCDNIICDSTNYDSYDYDVPFADFVRRFKTQSTYDPEEDPEHHLEFTENDYQGYNKPLTVFCPHHDQRHTCMIARELLYGAMTPCCEKNPLGIRYRK